MNTFTNRSAASRTGVRAVPDRSAPAGGTHRSRRRRWAVLAAVSVPLLLAGCNAYPSYGASRGATTQGNETFRLYSGMITTGIVVGGFVSLLILWTLFRYRRRSDEMPRQFHENIPVEIIYTVVPIIIVFVLFFFTVLTENNVDATVPANATVTSTGNPVVDIKVTGFQWGWQFNYPKSRVSISGETLNGPDNHGPQMVVPVGQTVQITLVSNDVIHGFFVRDFNFSRYALPGVVNVFDLTVDHAGTYDGQCTQICGLYHSEMLFSVRAVSPAAFDAWQASEVSAGNTIKDSGSSSANNAPSGTTIERSNA